MLEIVKYFLTLLTAFLAVWGVLHDYRTDGRMNNKGRTAIAGLIFLCVISVIAEFLSNKNKAKENVIAAEQLNKENKQREVLLLRLKEVDKRIESNISYLESLKKEISANHLEVKSTQNSIRKATDAQIEQQKTIEEEIIRFSEKAELELGRLSAPLSELYISSSLKFVGAEKSFPDYYEYLTPEFYHSEGAYSLADKLVPKGFDYSKLHYFYPRYFELAIYKLQNNKVLDSKAYFNLKPDLLLSAVDSEDNRILDDMYSNLDDGSIIRTKDLVPLTTKKSSGKITSQLDFTTLAQQGDYAVFSFVTTYPEALELTRLMLHTDKSYYAGVSLDNCELIYRRSGINIIQESGSEINNFRHVYSCKLWKANGLNER
ncbi:MULTISPECIES: hypothetical protein [Vibrio]|uniref:hypothetical protein n=1 Tax=Vibrio TaxID=662 RepID=UPI0006A5E5F7|nr:MULTISPECIES: hypothetical protein [Vibrio]EGQ7905638.1 hypothetical protein [Vibrio alginolyticus]EGQ9113594.1 hypothetical protein [Vibrio alginolyticus]EHA1101161.1 hypothetical protein [Vibrio alginolyticus]EHA1121599.1 hypothetical protein [Vibrio alginolyticus]EKY4215551.1 hypothetical protein [Vibrio alginolyticus]